MIRIWHRSLRCGRRRVMGAALLILLAPGQGLTQTNRPPEVRPPAPRRASFLLILADNVGYGDLGCYGQTRIKTPNLDKLAGKGIRFTRFYAGSPEDAPARAALLTGMEPIHSHAGFNQALPTDAVTVAALLKHSGYYTGLIGEWGLGDIGAALPARKGFDQFAGFLSPAHAREYFTDRIWRHDPESHFDGQERIYANEEGKRGQYMPDLLTEAAANFLHQHVPDQFNRYRPFFLCLAYPLPHNGPISTDSPYTNEPWPVSEKRRAAMITRMDSGIGYLMKQMDKLGISTNTVVCFTSVNGPRREDGMDPKFFDSTGPLRGLQGSVFEGGIRVPMIVRWPAQIQPGQVSDFVWAGWDFLPTAMEIALRKPPEQIDGLSVLPTLLGEAQTNRHAYFYWSSPKDGGQRALRMGDWKLVRVATNRVPQLYDLKSDPGEQTNLAGKQPDVVARLEKLMASLTSGSTNAAVTGAKADVKSP